VLRPPPAAFDGITEQAERPPEAIALMTSAELNALTSAQG
jgi:hypothetical protein